MSYSGRLLAKELLAKVTDAAARRDLISIAFAIKAGKLSLNDVPAESRGPAVCRAGVGQNPGQAAHIPAEILTPEYALELTRENPDVYHYLPAELKRNHDVIAAYVGDRPSSYLHVPAEAMTVEMWEKLEAELPALLAGDPWLVARLPERHQTEEAWAAALATLPRNPSKLAQVPAARRTESMWAAVATPFAKADLGDALRRDTHTCLCHETWRNTAQIDPGYERCCPCEVLARRVRATIAADQDAAAIKARVLAGAVAKNLPLDTARDVGEALAPVVSDEELAELARTHPHLVVASPALWRLLAPEAQVPAALDACYHTHDTTILALCRPANAALDADLKPHCAKALKWLEKNAKETGPSSKIRVTDPEVEAGLFGLPLEPIDGRHLLEPIDGRCLLFPSFMHDAPGQRATFLRVVRAAP